MSARIGLIANPAAGKDIRRLIAHGTSMDNQAKIAMLRRILVGLQAMGPINVLAMPDASHLIQRALEGIGGVKPQVDYVDMAVTNLPTDSTKAAQAMREADCACILVLGGDGTARIVSQADVPLLPISTGTNNVLPVTTEGTLAGMAAGAIALGLIDANRVCYRHKWLEIRDNDTYVDRALVDVAVIRGQFIGAKAVWDTSRLVQVVATRANPMSTGISAIAGMCCPVSVREPRGIALVIGPDTTKNNSQRIRAVIAPGLVESVGIQAHRSIAHGESVAIVDERPLVIALDGEREIVLNARSQATVTLHDDGPCIVDLEAAVHQMVSRHLFTV